MWNSFLLASPHQIEADHNLYHPPAAMISPACHRARINSYGRFAHVAGSTKIR